MMYHLLEKFHQHSIYQNNGTKFFQHDLQYELYLDKLYQTFLGFFFQLNHNHHLYSV